MPYLGAMFKGFGFCFPARSTSVPSGPDWLQEVKYDGYRLRVERDGDRVRLVTRGGHDWTKRYPWNQGQESEASGDEPGNRLLMSP
jgi:bifunctional non-homologous end joining protein LigD